MKSHVLAAWVVLGCVAGVSGPVWAGDWPQFRHDAGRTAAAPQALPTDLQLHWMRELGEPTPAYPHEDRLSYDRAYEPVVSGKTMFVPSMRHDSVTALDVETGERRWRFHANGPVRFAPAVADDRVYFVSDDGYLYCLDAEDGELQWKFRGRPADEADRWVMGNERLVSLWSARGGPVVHDGIVYFAAGVWPTEGVYVHAIDARSGEVVWTNSEADYIPDSNWDHGVGFDSGLTPQGYLAIVGDWLVVPGGTQLPAFFDLETGELGPYTMGWGGRVGQPKGTWFVAGVGDYLVHAGDLYDVTRPYEDRAEGPDYGRWIHPGGWTRLDMDPANRKRLGGSFRRPVLTEQVIYESGPEGIRARDLTSMTLQHRDEIELPDYREEEFFPDTFIATFDQLWQMPSDRQVRIKAGNHLYAAAPGVIEAIDTTADGGPETVWQAEIEGTPTRLIAAADRLFAVTERGRVYAFGSPRDGEVVHHTLDEAAEADHAEARAAQANDLLEASGIRHGYALVLGLEDGSLVEQLARQSSLHVIGVDQDPATVAAARRRIDVAGLYGERASVLLANPATHPVPPYLASLIVSENPDGLRERADGEALLRTVANALRPYGGVVAVQDESASVEGVKRALSEAGLEGQLHVQRAGEFVLAERPGPLPDSADWSHAAANAANSGASKDAVRSPLAVLWFNSQRYHRQPGHLEVRVAGGRMVILEAGLLRAVDVYTGRLLWERSVPVGDGPIEDPVARERAHRRGRPGALEPTTQMVALQDAIYVSDETSCLVYDPATGESVGQIELPESMEAPWTNLRVAGDYLVGLSGRHVVSVDRHTGEPVWQREMDRESISLAIGNAKVFCAEVANLRRGEDETEDGRLMALDLATGDVQWQRSGGSWLRYSPSRDILVTPVGFFRGEDGEPITLFPDRRVMLTQPPRWLQDRAGPLPEEGIPGFIAGDRLLTGSDDRVVAYEIPTGEHVGDLANWPRRGCTSLRASTHMLTTRYRSNAAWVDVEDGAVSPFLGIRPACHSNNNMFPANGVFSMPNFSGGCSCNFSPMSVGFVPATVLRDDRDD